MENFSKKKMFGLRNDTFQMDHMHREIMPSTTCINPVEVILLGWNRTSTLRTFLGAQFISYF